MTLSGFLHANIIFPMAMTPSYVIDDDRLKLNCLVLRYPLKSSVIAQFFDL